MKEGDTELILRNLIACEQFSPQVHHQITSHHIYAAAMDMVINTQEDVAILVESKVIVNCMASNEEAAKLINHNQLSVAVQGRRRSSSEQHTSSIHPINYKGKIPFGMANATDDVELGSIQDPTVQFLLRCTQKQHKEFSPTSIQIIPSRIDYGNVNAVMIEHFVVTVGYRLKL
ncbi:Protein of unknown function DUF247, plant [Cynara cardunculus var. scolymus]|uniref:Uncharacterized protein n=1 Tax=Cynara cardunculus var. scolymus TaxID=59895 RepID=A0A124SBZ0_CYNCS|nr:Protein of unknown function DUF247, plant [Cynara cardunculus var. scolymus]